MGLGIEINLDSQMPILKNVLERRDKLDYRYFIMIRDVSGIIKYHRINYENCEDSMKNINIEIMREKAKVTCIKDEVKVIEVLFNNEIRKDGLEGKLINIIEAC